MSTKSTTTRKKSTTAKKKTTTRKTAAKSTAKKAAPKKRVAKKTTSKTVAKKTATRKPRKSAAQRLAETPTPKAASSQEQTIVESVLNERNLMPGIAGVELSESQEAEIQDMLLNGTKQKSIAKNAKQQAFLDSFNAIYDQTVAEVNDLAAYAPKEEILEFTKGNPEVAQALVEKFRDAEPWTVHNVGDKYFLKTGINTITPVRDYIFKLEKVVLDAQKQKNLAEHRYNDMLEVKDEAIELYRKQINELTSVQDLSFFGLIKLAFSKLFGGN